MNKRKPKRYLLLAMIGLALLATGIALFMWLIHSALLIFLAVIQVELLVTMVFLGVYILMMVVGICLGVKYRKEM